MSHSHNSLKGVIWGYIYRGGYCRGYQGGYIFRLDDGSDILQEHYGIFCSQLYRDVFEDVDGDSLVVSRE